MCRLLSISLQALVLLLLLFSTGCSLVQERPSAGLDARGLQGGAAAGGLAASGSEEVFQRIKQAKSQNSIVLQVDGDDEPVRVLPLPPEGRSVNVSDLLEQTGVASAFGGMQVRVYRDSPKQVGGVRMDVHFDGKQVRPESDYALRPGDRIVIRRDESTLVGRFLGGLVPSNTMKALGG